MILEININIFSTFSLVFSIGNIVRKKKTPITPVVEHSPAPKTKGKGKKENRLDCHAWLSLICTPINVQLIYVKKQQTVWEERKREQKTLSYPVKTK